MEIHFALSCLAALLNVGMATGQFRLNPKPNRFFLSRTEIAPNPFFFFKPKPPRINLRLTESEPPRPE